MTNIRYDQNDNKNENNYHNHNRCNEEEQLQQKPTHGVSLFLETARKTIQIQFFHPHVATVSVFVETKRNDFDFWESSSHQSL